MKRINKDRIGDTLESFLEGAGIREEVYAGAIKDLVAMQIRKEMAKQDLSVAEMARRMDTSRSQLHRLIEDNAESVTLVTLAKAATALGCRLDVRLLPRRAAKTTGQNPIRAR